MQIKNNKLLVGFAKEDITPALGTELFGYPLPLRSAERINDSLTAGAVAIKQDAETVIFISIELAILTNKTATDIRESVSAKTGVKPENVIVATIHTHSGPITVTTTGWGPADGSYIDDILIPKAVLSAKKALENITPAVMGLGLSNTLAGINRREIDADGNVILGQNPNGPYDPTMTLVCFKKQSGEYIGSIVHFAAHPTAAGRNKSFTRDWPGVMIDKVEELTNAPCIYFNGAAGDVGPRLSNGQTGGGGDEKFIYEIGNIAAADIEKAYESIVDFSDASLSVASETVTLPCAPAPTREYTDARIKEFEASPETIESVRASLYDQLKKVKAFYDEGKEIPTELSFVQTIVALGDFVIVPTPFEPFCNISLSIREKSPYKHTITLGYSNGNISYLPTEDQLPFGGYEVDSFRFAGVTGLADDTDKRLIEQESKIINELYKQNERK